MITGKMNVHDIRPIDGDLANLMRKTFANDGRAGYVKVEGCILPERYKLFADDIENFEVRDDDVWVSSFPKSGTTWAQEMIWCIANDLDFERAKLPISQRFPYLEHTIMVTSTEATQYEKDIHMKRTLLGSIDSVKDMPSPRFIKSHLPTYLYPRQLRMGEKRPKIVCIVRNAKDTCISFYHFCKLYNGFDGSFEDFATLFLGDRVYFTPFCKNVLSFWNQRNHYNMLFLKYEDMKKDLPSVIRKAASFLGKNLTDDQVSLLSEHLSFSNMKSNPAVNHEGPVSRLHNVLQVKREGVFMRSGTTGQWKTVMTPELVKRFDDWVNQHLDGTGLDL